MDFFCVIGFVYVSYVLVYLISLIFLDCDLRLAWEERFGTKISTLKGKVVWITGASSGIGKGLALKLAENGVKLVLSSRRRDQLLKVREECLDKGRVAGLAPCDVLVLEMDVLAIEKHADCFQRVTDHFGKLDILVNNAGRSQRANWEKIETAVDRQVFELNVFSVISLCRLAVDHFLKNGSGHLAVTSSIAGLIGVPFSGSYTGSKHAVHGYMDSFRSEKMHIPDMHVTVFCPGPIFTEFLAESFTEREGEKFGQSASRTDKRMTVERCAHLYAVALANHLEEGWAALFPILPITYALKYFPNASRGIIKAIGARRLQNMRDSRETVAEAS